MTAKETLSVLGRERCSAILRTQIAAAVRPAMQAAVDGGFKVVELTLNTPGALAEIRHWSQNPDLLVGAGTVLDTEQAKAALDAGARFLVSPVVDPEVIGYALEEDVVVIPGTSTPTEMYLAHQAGAQIVKVFPAPAGGPTFVRMVLGPLPFLRIFPTSGVTEENALEYLAAGAFGLGFVASLFWPEDLEAERYQAIRERAKRITAAVSSAS